VKPVGSSCVTRSASQVEPTSSRLALRDDSKVGAGWDVLMLQGEPLFSRRCVDERGARYMAQSFKQDTLKAG